MQALAPYEALPSFRPTVRLLDNQVEPCLLLANDCRQRWIWHSRFGAILIEVRGDDVFVNGQRVDRHAP